MIIKGKPLLINILIIFIAITALFLIASRMVNNRLLPFLPDLKPNSVLELSDLIVVEKPRTDEAVISPLLINGRARGFWYFEASFPIRIFDDNGIELGLALAQAGGDPADGGAGWMTEDFVPFASILEFKKPSTERGVLVLQKDNPSGLPEHDAELRIPIVFNLENWSDEQAASQGCLVTGCSGQICSDEDIVTTCEYKEEYACYKTAKCERQEDGKCGWTPSEELIACLMSAWEMEPTPQ